MRWLPLLLAATIGFGSGTAQLASAQGAAAAPLIPSKAAHQAARKAAAAAVRAEARAAKPKGAGKAVQSPGASLQTTTLQATTFGAVSTLAAATPATDEATIPHYFGPFPNWANSPFTLPDAKVTIAPPTTTGGTPATATASVGANGVVTGFTITNPGSGYTAAPAVTITDTAGGNTSATATAAVTLNGSVTAINMALDTSTTPPTIIGGSGYIAPLVNITGGGGTATPVQVGNTLSARQLATDGASQVFVVVPTALPAGVLTSFETFNQAATDPTLASAGKTFHAYVLRPAGANQYTVIYDSGPLTVPTLTNPTGEVVNFDVADVAVQANDVLAFYGQGIPFDIGSAADVLSYPAPTAPTQGSSITLATVDYPLYPEVRTYSFAANVLDTSAAPPLTPATATAYGGVDAVELTAAGIGYKNPTVDFDMPDGVDGVKPVAHALTTANADGTVTITGIVVDQTGSGYSAAPNVVIRDGNLYDPTPNPGTGATAAATLAVQSVVVETFGSGYTAAPTVTFVDTAPGTGSGASATAVTNFGTVSAITLTNGGGAGYLTAGGIKKFVDTLPPLCDPVGFSPLPSCGSAKNNLDQNIPVAVPDTTTFPGADYYVIAVVQSRECMSSSLPNCGPNPDPTKPRGTLLRKYVQLSSPAIPGTVPLRTDLLNGTSVPTTLPGGVTGAVTNPHYLGPVILASKDRPVRITFYNLLPTGTGGDLIIPTDSSLMGAGFVPASVRDLTDGGTVLDEVRNPPCSQFPKPTNCFRDNRATLHLHGGLSPWISDGTPHQWITPKGESTSEPEGVSVGQVPDMSGASKPAAVPDCSGEIDGCQTFYYTNQQSARMMFYHDHAFGTTRLNVYLGEAAGYLISDDTEQGLVATGTIPGAADTIPLIVQDRTFVPDAAQLAEQDPTWNSTRWGGFGDFWYHHVYMPAQNPGDPSGMSAYGRWMYGPWFWPPATPPHGPIDNPYFTGTCNLDDSTTWQYQTDPFCEPPLIPGTPNISAGMEQFNDTPLVNGTAYPTLEVDPKTYRLRVLNAANDRFMNLQLYPADPTLVSTGTNGYGKPIGSTEVALDPTELAAAQLDPVISPTPVLGSKVVNGKDVISTAGPDWIVIGSEGGFLPAPAVVDGQQPTTWITDPTRFDVGNVDKHSLLLAPAERADVIVDFSQYAGKTLILYNDAPAAFPARVPSYDYYTGAPDLSPVGAPAILPGYGPNTRTVMQIRVANKAAAPAFNLSKLRTAFTHKADGSGVFESGQHPIIVGQAAYNGAYGTKFVASGNCNTPPGNPGNTTNNQCDGFARIADQGGTLFGFNTLLTSGSLTGVFASKLKIEIEPKGIHDEMNSAAFDEFGRMSANMGLEFAPATPAGQNIVLYPYVNPPTELIDGTKLPKNQIGMDVTPIATADDGTQIWKITHNGVDTHPLHFHLYDVQVLNRVTWDNIIIAPEATELGWKDTVRVSPLEDTIVALRPVVPQLPWELPNSIRPLNPALPTTGPFANMGFNNVDANGNPTTTPVTNQPVNFGWEYVWHCHILSHEEMDMMRPQSLVLPPKAPAGLTATKIGSGAAASVRLDWNDTSIAETQSLVQRGASLTGPWVDLTTVNSPLGAANTTGPRTYTDTAAGSAAEWNYYRVVAQNTVGYGGEFMALTAESAITAVQVAPTVIASVAPTSLAFGNQTVGTTSGARTVTLSNSGRAAMAINSITVTAPGPFAQTNNCGASLAAATSPSAPATCTISVTFAPTVVGAAAGALTIASSGQPNLTVALSGTGVSAGPNAPTSVSIQRTSVTQALVSWTDNSTNEASFQVQSSNNSGLTWTTVATFTSTNAQRTGTGARSINNVPVSNSTNAVYRVVAVQTTPPTPARTTPSAAPYASLNNTVAPPSEPVLGTNPVMGGNGNGSNRTVALTWTDPSNNNASYAVQRCPGTCTSASNRWANVTTNLAGNALGYTDTGLARQTTFSYRIRAVNSVATVEGNIVTVRTP